MTGQAMDVRGQARARLLWVDTAKGLGIILVVLAHVWTRGPVRDAIYAFHMPLFFLLAGYFARPRPMKAFAAKQWHAMVLPYVAFLLTLFLADLAIEHLRGHRPLFRTGEAAAWALLIGGSELRGPMTIFWFVPCLILARLAQNALSCLWPDPRDWKWVAAMALSLAFGLWIGARSDFSPWGALSAPVALVLLWLGALWQGIGKDRWLVLGGLGIGALALLLWKPVPLNMKLGDYGVPVLSLALAVAMSLGLCAFARLLAPLSFLALLGSRSLTIMYCHVAMIHYCAPYFGKPVLFALALLVPVAVHEGLVRTRWGRLYFLGMEAPAASKTAPN